MGRYGHTTWTLRDGSLASHPRSIGQTTDGYLWLATESGLVRFDGARFVRWRALDDSPLPSSATVALTAGRDGSLWVGTTQGLSRLKNGRFTAIAELDGHHVATLVHTRDGTVWAGTHGGTGNARLCAISEQGNHCYGSDGQFGRFILSLHEDARGRLWIGAATGLLLWNHTTATRHPTPLPLQEIHAIVDYDDGRLLASLNREVRPASESGFDARPLTLGPDLKPTTMLRDRDGGVWIGTQDQGVLFVRGQRVDRFDRTHGLSGDFVLSLFEDREGNVWAATVGGLDRFRKLTAMRLSIRDGLASDTVTAVAAGSDGSVWLATVAGLNRWQDGRVLRHPLPGLPATEPAGSLFEDSRHRLWVSSLQGLFYFLMSDRQHVQKVSDVPTRHVHAIVEDAARIIWISDQRQGLLRIGEAGDVETFPLSLFKGNEARVLIADTRGGLWLGFSRGGVAYFKDRRIEKWIGAEDGLSPGRVNGLHLARDGTLWVAAEGGLSRIDDGNRVTRTGEARLPCEAVQWVIEDDLRDLWVHTSCGLVHIAHGQTDRWSRDATATIESTVFGNADGVLQYADLGGYGPKVTLARDGRIFFATYDGVGVIDPRRLPFNDVPPPVHVEQVTADRVEYSAAPHVRLPPLVRDVRIDFSALSLVAPEKMRFRYRLEGRDTEWVDAATRRQAFYTDLRPGTYRFQVVASNNHGVWNHDGAVINLSIEPAVHQTWVFRFAMVLLGVAMLAFWHGLRIKRLAVELNVRFEERLAERARIAQELHDTLLQGVISSSMQLHFVAADTADPTVRERLDRILSRISGVVDEARRAVTDLRAPTPNDLERALVREAEQFRGEAAIDIQFSIKGEVRTLHPLMRDVAYQVGREALANAFKHAHAGRVEIEVEYTRDAFKLFVRDNGCGMEAALIDSGRSGHWGLRDMRERAERIGGSLRLWSRPNTGTEVSLNVPGHLAFEGVVMRWRQRLRRRL